MRVQSPIRGIKSCLPNGTKTARSFRLASAIAVNTWKDGSSGWIRTSNPPVKSEARRIVGVAETRNPVTRRH